MAHAKNLVIRRTILIFTGVKSITIQSMQIIDLIEMHPGVDNARQLAELAAVIEHELPNLVNAGKNKNQIPKNK